MLRVSPALRWIWLIGSALVGAGAVGVGTWDAVTAVRPSEQVVGSVIALAGAGLIFSAGRVARDGARFRERGYPVVGFVLGALPGVSVCLIQLDAAGYTHRILVWAAVALIPLSFAVVAWARGVRPGDRHTTVWATVAVTLLAAGLPLIGGVFRPVASPETLDIEVAVEVAGWREDAVLGKVAVVDTIVTVRNISQRRLTFVASTYTLLAVTRPLVPGLPGSGLEQQIIDEARSYDWSARFEKPTARPDLIEAGHLYTAGNYLEPGQHDVSRLPSVIPIARYNTAEMIVNVATGFADRLLLDKRVSGGGMTQAWTLRPTSLVSRLATGDQQVSVRYFRSTEIHGTVYDFTVTAGTTATPNSFELKYNPHTESSLGIGVTTASSEIALDVAAP